MAYGCSPLAVRGRMPSSTPNSTQNTASCDSGMRKFQANPRTEPLYRARRSRQAKSTSSWRRATSARMSAITVEASLGGYTTDTKHVTCGFAIGSEPTVSAGEKKSVPALAPGLNENAAKPPLVYCVDDVMSVVNVPLVRIIVT